MRYLFSMLVIVLGLGLSVSALADTQRPQVIIIAPSAGGLWGGYHPADGDRYNPTAMTEYERWKQQDMRTSRLRSAVNEAAMRCEDGYSRACELLRIRQNRLTWWQQFMRRH